MEEGMLGKAFSVLGLSMLATACSDDVTRVADHRGAIPPGWESDISGVWDFVGSVRASGESLAGSLTIDRQVFVLQFENGESVDYSAAPGPALSIGYLPDCDPDGRCYPPIDKPYDLTRDSLGMSLGVIPSDAGGSWTLTDRNRSNCGASLDPDSFAATCSYAPYSGPFDGRLDAVRTQVLSSVFGELGGVWELVCNSGRCGRCTATFSDNNFNAHCEGTGSFFDGAISFTLFENVGTGFSPEGLEISAARR
jgi:hypothetical protein